MPVKPLAANRSLIDTGVTSSACMVPRSISSAMRVAMPKVSKTMRKTANSGRMRSRGGICLPARSGPGTTLAENSTGWGWPVHAYTISLSRDVIASPCSEGASEARYRMMAGAWPDASFCARSAGRTMP